MGFETLELRWGLQRQKHLLQQQETYLIIAPWAGVLLALVLNTGFFRTDF